MPAFDDYLLCGISSQLNQQIKDFDHVIDIHHNDFQQSGLKQSSLIRMSFLAVINSGKIAGKIGSISDDRYKTILNNLAGFITSEK